MPVNAFTTGRDVVLDVVDSTGAVLNFDKITGFSSKQETNGVKVKPLGGPPIFLEIPDGWSGSFDLERRNGNLDAYFAQTEADYYNGLNSQSVRITETITERDGSVSQYRYTGCVLKYDDAGAKKGDDTVKQRISFMASRRLRVA